MKRFLSVIATAFLLAFSLSVAAFASDAVAYVAYNKGNDANDGLSSSSPKRSIGQEGGAINLVKNGGTIVVSEKMYFGANYTFNLNGGIVITAKHDGVDYRNPQPATNPASGVIKMKPGTVLTIASDVTLKDVILLQEYSQCTIIVSGGATFTVDESVTTATNNGKYMKLIVSEGSTALINGGTFDSIGGDGTVKIGEKAKIINEYVGLEKEEVNRLNNVCFIDLKKGDNANDGLSAEKAVKSYSSGVFKRIFVGGTVVVSGSSVISGSGTANVYSLPILSKPLTFTSVYDGKDYRNEKCVLTLTNGTTMEISSDVKFDNITLGVDEQDAAIVVKSGATLTVTDTVAFKSSANGSTYTIKVEKGGMAILSETAKKLCKVEGEGKVLAYSDGILDVFKQYVDIGTMVRLTIGSQTAYINSIAHTLDASPINRNNRTMLPVRFLANAFGVSNDGIKWDAATRTATLSNSEVTIVVTIDAPSMTVNGETVALDSPAIIEKNRTYLPVRAIANALGVSNDNIVWDARTNTAILVK